MKTAMLLLIALVLYGCATNPGIDHRIVCSTDGHAAFATTYGPLAFFNLAPDADVICATMTKTPAIVMTPPAVAPAKPASAP